MTLNWYRARKGEGDGGAILVAYRPFSSKYRICGVLFALPAAGIIIPYIPDRTGVAVGRGTGARRRSLTTLARMLVEAVWEVAFRFVCTPTGIKPKTAIKQKAAMPRASVNSTSEKAGTEGQERFIAGRSVRCRQNRLFGLRRGSLWLD